MGQDEIETRLLHGSGQTVNVAFGGHTETVIVVSVDPDGFVCRAQSPPGDENSAEFWISFEEISAVRECSF